jgi:Rieske Fe-S protein
MTSVPDSPLRLRLRVAFKLMAWLAFGVAGAVALAYVTGGPSAPGREPSPAPKRIDVSALEPGQARALMWRDRRVIVLRRRANDGQSWSVVFARDPTHACPVAWRARAEAFICSCAQARYAPDGERVPAGEGAPLASPSYRVTPEGKVVLGEGAS